MDLCKSVTKNINNVYFNYQIKLFEVEQIQTNQEATERH